MESKHTREGVIAQFVAGRLSRKERGEFEAHLQPGCQSCEGAVRWYRGLSRMLQRDSAYEPPESSIRSVMDAFRRHQTQSIGFFCIVAEKLFDSFLNPVPAGVRQPGSTERLILYQAGEMHIDLKIDKPHEERERLLIGQMVHRVSASAENFRPVKVTLREGKRVIQSTYANELGEFVFRVLPRESCQLEILLTDSRRILVPDIPLA